MKLDRKTDMHAPEDHSIRDLKDAWILPKKYYRMHSKNVQKKTDQEMLGAACCWSPTRILRKDAHHLSTTSLYEQCTLFLKIETYRPSQRAGIFTLRLVWNVKQLLVSCKLRSALANVRSTVQDKWQLFRNRTQSGNEHLRSTSDMTGAPKLFHHESSSYRV